jgi:hypothetical protein
MCMAAFDNSVDISRAELYFPSVLTPEYIELDKQIKITKIDYTGRSSGMMTRSSRGHIACRFSAIVYIIICFLNKYNYKHYKLPSTDIKGDAKIVKTIFNSVCSNSSNLYTFLMNNIIDPTIVNILYGSSVSSSYLQTKPLFFMGFLNVSDEAKTAGRGIGIIGHFFVIVKRGGRLFIVSSYGCEFDIPQTEIELDLEEWDKFIGNFHNQDKNMKPFLSKYFLNSSTAKMNTDVPLDEITSDTTPAQLVEHEIEKFVTTPHEIISLDNIVDLIVSHFSSIRGGKPKKKSRKYKYQKNKKSRKY